MALSCCKKLPALFCNIIFILFYKHNGKRYCLNSLDSTNTRNKFKEHKNVCKNHGYWCIEMPK